MIVIPREGRWGDEKDEFRNFFHSISFSSSGVCVGKLSALPFPKVGEGGGVFGKGEFRKFFTRFHFSLAGRGVCVGSASDFHKVEGCKNIFDKIFFMFCVLKMRKVLFSSVQRCTHTGR